MAASTAPTADFPMPEIDENGVDRSQVRRMLEMTPLERLQTLESALASMTRIRSGGRESEVAVIPYIEATIAEIERRGT